MILRGKDVKEDFQQFKEGFEFGLEFTPVVGDGMAVYDYYKDFGNNDWKGNTFNGAILVVGFLPGGDSVKEGKQIHHFLTNKHLTKYTEKIEEITSKYGLDLDGEWNKGLMEHSGRHAGEYHEFMIEQISEISNKVGSDKEKFLEEFEKLKSYIKENPDKLYKKGW